MGLLIVKWLFRSISRGRSRTVVRSPKVIEVEFGDACSLSAKLDPPKLFGMLSS